MFEGGGARAGRRFLGALAAGCVSLGEGWVSIGETVNNWVVSRVESGFESRVGLMAVGLAAARVVEIAVDNICCLAAQVGVCLVYGLFMAMFVLACVKMDVSEAARGAALVAVPLVWWMVG